MGSVYRGVYLSNTRTIKFNARICYRYTRLSLGSFKHAAEAALAYDRAAMKLHGINVSLNFPGLYTEAETWFQSLKSEVEIVQMITNHTYASELASFVSGLNHIAVRAHVNNDIVHQLLFYVNLICDEVRHRLIFLPQALALHHFPEIAGLMPGDPNTIRKMNIHFLDRRRFCSWSFEFCYLKNIRTFAITGEMDSFFRLNNLHVGDTVLFYKYYHVEAERNRTLYMIDCIQRPAVMLFGVQIS
ncbi:hypothetical protein L6164_028562 [Bauhinia variegata]|uniref:Uncharacterized protein n=1 Tax=Bauhinia variegata TaxID=167791 RepID=A0ACB9L643_BAUVA|nr:hypothetical protein L6164_028562 [Bauhinia variegata]